MRLLYCSAFAAVLLLAGSAGAAPYLENFDDDAPTTSDFAEPVQAGPQGGKMIGSRSEGTPPKGGSVVGRINIQKIPGIGNVLKHSVSASRGSTGTSTSSTLGNVVELPDVPGTNFLMTVDVLLDTALMNNPNAGNIGLILLGHGSNVTQNTPDRYQVVMQMAGSHPGRVQIMESSGGSTNAIATSDDGNLLTFTDDREYRIQVAVSYAKPGDRKSAVTISATVSSGSEMQTVTHTDSSPRSGSFFGLRTGLNVSSATPTVSASYEVEYDNFALTPGGASTARNYTGP